ncbi:hypothetical protein HPP92_015140 [Vanilla planifolia]|uniref:GTD-binding domain-containing protein n=1 Tax=Vanilla planifolia TaxID=51239 RepID=A0A835QSV5_VANPL|nr:hypothetical protein HPP92_015140 [Vanilla planifolia]
MPLPSEEEEEEARSEVEEEEQNAAAAVASEAMSMILRLQREKAELEMESRQFQRLADERMAHDHREIAAFEELPRVYKNPLHSTSDATAAKVIATPIVVDEAGNRDGVRAVSLRR